MRIAALVVLICMASALGGTYGLVRDSSTDWGGPRAAGMVSDLGAVELAPSPTPERDEHAQAVRHLPSASIQGIVVPTMQIVPSQPPADIATAIRADFILGYRDGKGSPLWEARFIAAFWGPTESCPNGESGGNPLAVSAAGRLGLGQFEHGTWHSVWKLAALPVQDWRSPYWQGYATAIWSGVVEPGSPGGWACFQ